MVTILLIIPYKALEQPIYDLLKEINHPNIEIKTTHIYGTNHSEIQNYHPDIIIARGMTCANLRQLFPDIHMVEITISSFDILAALSVAKQTFHPQRAALCIGSLSEQDLKYFESLAGFAVDYYQTDNEDDIDRVLAEGLKKNTDVFIGGLTICQKCREKGIPDIHIKTSPFALKDAVSEAVSTAMALNMERTKTILVQSLLDNNPDAILSVNCEGIITTINSNACKMRRIPARMKLVGKKLDTYWAGIDWQGAITARKSSETLLEAFGALYYARCTPISFDDDGIVGVLITIQTASTIRNAEEKIRKELANKGLVARYTFHNIVGISQTMKEAISTAVKYAQVEANVMLVGETGTGKELFAHSIHMASQRRNEPFVAVNCAVLPESLLESELFGYVEGAFSGASKGGKTGLFELAHNGTIFLDEIGEMPISLQAKLLRVLQEKEIRRLGDDRVRHINVRVISATNIDIKEQIEQKNFRSDLFYRLNVLGLHLAPVRDRPEDIPVLIDNFLQEFSKQYHKPKPVFDQGAARVLDTYDWPGNAREMKNFCEKLVILTDSAQVDRQQLAALGITAGPAPDGGVPKPTKAEVMELLQSKSLTNEELAKRLGVSRSTLWRWSKKNQ